MLLFMRDCQVHDSDLLVMGGCPARSIGEIGLLLFLALMFVATFPVIIPDEYRDTEGFPDEPKS